MHNLLKCCSYFDQNHMNKSSTIASPQTTASDIIFQQTNNITYYILVFAAGLQARIALDVTTGCCGELIVKLQEVALALCSLYTLLISVRHICDLFLLPLDLVGP